MTDGHAPARMVRAGVFLMFCAGLAATPARAQTNVGAGGITNGLPSTEPTSAVLVWGPLKLAPGVQLREAGWDSNVFDEAVDPKEDYVISAMPDVQIYARTPWVRLAAYTGVDLTYYNTYESERSVSDQYRARVDILGSNIRPFVGGGYVNLRTRPNGEISVRADRLETEFSGGMAFELSSTSRFWGAVSRLTTEYRSTAEFEDVPLDQSLNRNSYTYSGGFQTALTPLTTVTLTGSYVEDRFRASPARDSNSSQADAEFTFAPSAVVDGRARFGFRNFDPDDPELEPYRGLVMSASLGIPLTDIGRLGFGALRDVQYSFDETDAYYVENTFEISYTHFIFGNFDLQARGGWSGFDYGHREGEAARRDTLTTWAAGVGYNLPNRTRIAFQYEETERRSPTISERNYDRRRAYLSWTFAL